MVNLTVVTLKFTPVLLLILLGMLVRGRGMVGSETIRDLKKIIVNLSLPSVLFLTFARMEFKADYILIFASMFLFCTMMLLLGAQIKKMLRTDNKYFPAVFGGFETGMLGYALYSAFYGAENTYKLAIFDLGQVTFVFFVLVSYLQRQNGKSAGAKQLFIDFLKSPVILSILFGILFGSTGLTSRTMVFPFAEAIVTTLNLLGSLTEPLICLIIGYEIQIRPENFLNPLLTVLIRIVLLIFAAFLLNTFLTEKLLHLDGSFKLALYTLFLLPPPFVIPIYMDDNACGEKQFILSVFSIHIVLTLFAFMVLAVLTA